MRAFLLFGSALIGTATYTQVSIFDGISNGTISADTMMHHQYHAVIFSFAWY
jgi:hypothetical protein